MSVVLIVLVDDAAVLEEIGVVGCHEFGFLQFHRFGGGGWFGGIAGVVAEGQVLHQVGTLVAIDP